jgi:hypothetical protein
MFDRNAPAMPIQPAFRPDGSMYSVAEYGLTKFEQCAKDFTAVWARVLSIQHELTVWGDEDANYEAVRLGILTAKEFCMQTSGRK